MLDSVEIWRRGLRDAQQYLFDMRRFNWNEFGINYAERLVCTCLDNLWAAQQAADGQKEAADAR